MVIFILFVILLIVGAYYLFRQINPNVIGSKNAKPLVEEEYSEELTATGLSEGKNYANWLEDPPLYLNEKVPRIQVLVKDPDWLYAYWHWGQDAPKLFELHYGADSWENSSAVLRYHQLNSDNFFDIPINSYANSWYIQTDYPNTNITIFLGRLFKGQFIQLAASNQTTIPVGFPAEEINPQWKSLFGQEQGTNTGENEAQAIAWELGAPSSMGISSWGKRD